MTTPTRRPGGRTARTRAAVHQATLDLLQQSDWSRLTIPLIAERAGVHAATVYRRWGTVAGLLGDLIAEQVATLNPLSDTGSLRGDLEQYAVQAAETLASPLGVVILRALVLSQPSERHDPYGLTTERTRQLDELFDRARARGESPPTHQELLEVVLAPIYFHALFTAPVTPDRARTLVTRLLDLTPARRP